MTDSVESVVRESLRQVAPDIDIAQIAAEEDLREEFDIDSMDFLKLVARLSAELKISIPEAEYPDMSTYSDLLGYLMGKVETPG